MDVGGNLGQALHPEVRCVLANHRLDANPALERECEHFKQKKHGIKEKTNKIAVTSRITNGHGVF